MIIFPPYPIPIIVKETKKEGYLIYVESGGQFENDLWTCCICEGGDIITCSIVQLSIHKNFTFGIVTNE